VTRHPGHGIVDHAPVDGDRGLPLGLCLLEGGQDLALVGDLFWVRGEHLVDDRDLAGMDGDLADITQRAGELGFDA
jgi:hypothetical protein